jgi:hypothetical protein
MKLNPDDIRRLARFTLDSKPDELTCDEWLHRVGEYVEAGAAGGSLSERHEQVARHVDACPSCAQELEVLRDLLRE